MKDRIAGAGSALLLLWLACACTDAEGIFTSGRIENRCNGAIPVCGLQAGCVLGTDQYLRGEFPGGQNLIVRTEVEQARLVARLLLIDPMAPGTELLVKACSTDCGKCEKNLSTDVNLFDLAGDDNIVESHLDVEGIGDHRVEIFSDMTSEFLFTVDIEE
jgi:hypothetical protein